MRKLITFIAGFIIGIISTFTIAYIIKSNISNNGITLFEHPGECVSTNNFMVIQVIDNDHALAQEIIWDPMQGYTPTNLLVLITNDIGEYYYDNQIIQNYIDKCMRQIGIYKYHTKANIEKTIPIVMLMNK